MVLRNKLEILLLVIFFIFSLWLMGKSFSYDNRTHEFVIARNEVGDFGLHLALIRSFSWGNNFPAQSPFYPGPPLPYHYAFDLLAGLLEHTGIRVDYAVNGISVVFFVLLLYLIYRLPQFLFDTEFFTGILAVTFFVFSSNLSFFDFFRGKSLGVSLLQQFWRLPDYINKGPFDGSIISIFSSLNPYLNQRHLIVGMALSVLMIFYVARKLMKNIKIFPSSAVILGILLGLGTRIHLLLTFGTIVVLICLFLLFRKARLIVYLAAFFLLFALPHLNELKKFSQTYGMFFNPGFLATRPLTLWSFVQYWWLNTGLALIFIPLGVIWASAKQKKFFFAAFPLFVFANLFQFSFRMEHNYSLIELFFILSLPFLVLSIDRLWKKTFIWKGFVVVSVIGLTLSGFLNLMVIKNDFHYRVRDVGSSPLMQWIKETTPPDSIFLSPQNLYDPVTLSGRRSYFGATYYLEVMGYDVVYRRGLTKDFFEADDGATLEQMRRSGIQFIVVPNKPIADFPYNVNSIFLGRQLRLVYKDDAVRVFQL